MKIPVKKRNGETIYMLIDSEDLHLIKDLNLIQSSPKKSNTTYIKSLIRENNKYLKSIHIHRLVMGLGDFKDDKRIVNHINGIGYDNRKKNLEICDVLHNNLTINRLNSNLGSIIFENDPKRRKKWRFLMCINKITHRKRFMTWKEANEYRVKYLRQIYGNELVDNRLHNRLINQIEKEVPKKDLTIKFD
jgi:hypothetical protein